MLVVRFNNRDAGAVASFMWVGWVSFLEGERRKEDGDGMSSRSLDGRKEEPNRWKRRVWVGRSLQHVQW